jgi:hypothetical protein
MLHMSEKKKGKAGGRGPGRPPGRVPSVTIFARVPPALGEALEAYVEATRPKTTNTAVVELALERYLSEVGFWPPGTEGGER